MEGKGPSRSEYNDAVVNRLKVVENRYARVCLAGRAPKKRLGPPIPRGGMKIPGF